HRYTFMSVLPCSSSVGRTLTGAVCWLCLLAGCTPRDVNLRARILASKTPANCGTRMDTVRASTRCRRAAPRSARRVLGAIIHRQTLVLDPRMRVEGLRANPQKQVGVRTAPACQ